MYSYKECQNLIELKISELEYSAHPIELYDPIKYILAIGGKRLRPCLTLLANNLFSEDITPAVYPALGLEVFHNFTLLHDDIMDNASLRRNQNTVHVKWNNNTAILSGDAMMILAYGLIAKTTDEQQFASVFKIFNKTALEVCEGQQLDMNFENKINVSENEYIDMIKLKTAVLISASLSIGGIVAKTTAENIDLLYDLGLNIGLAFQVQDDLLDTFGNAEKFGKAIGGDILLNKKTYLLINALNSGNADVVKKLNSWIVKKDFDPKEKINSVIDLYRQVNVKENTEQLIDHYFNEGIKKLERISVNNERKEILKNLLIKMKKRES